MVCPKCGTNNSDDSSFCLKCGANLKDEQSLNVQNTSVPAQNLNNVNVISIPSTPVSPDNGMNSNSVPNVSSVQVNNINMNTDLNNSSAQVDNVNMNAYPSNSPAQVNIVNMNVDSNNQNQTSNTKTKNNKKIIFVIMIVLLLGAAGLGIKGFINKHKNNDSLDKIFSADTPIRVMKDEKYGYIDSKGKFVIQPQYTKASEFHGDYAVIFGYGEDNNEKETYHIIDTNGNIKLTANMPSEYSMRYLDPINMWIINYKLYDGNLNQITPDGITVSTNYGNYNYLIWENDNNNTAGLMNKNGDITFTYQFAEDENYIDIEVESKYDDYLEDTYCLVNVENEKYAIINCDTGKMVYDFTDKYISRSYNNVFTIYNNTKDFDFDSKIFIYDDKVAYDTSNSYVDLTIYGDYKYVSIYDRSASERQSYLDLTTGQITKELPDYSSVKKSTFSDLEIKNGLTVYTCDGEYGLKRDDEVIVTCDWEDFDLLDENLYEYLKSIGKEYILAEKKSKVYLLNLKDGSSVAEFNTFSTNYIEKSSKSSFIYYEDEDTDKYVVYNLITGQSLTVDDEDDLTVYSNYITVNVSNQLHYYNMDLERIYIEE